MTDPILLSMRLQLAYRINGLIYRLKKLPLIKRLIPAKAYDAGWLKTLALIFTIFREIGGTFFGKIIYVLVFFGGPALLALNHEIVLRPESMFLHVFVLLTILGAFTNNPFPEASEDSWYAVFLMLMDAKKYVLTRYFYRLIRHVAGYLVILGIASLLVRDLKLTIPRILLVTLAVAGAKLLKAALDLASYEKRGKTVRSTALLLSLTAGLLLLSYGLPFLGYEMPAKVSLAIALLFILGAFPAVRILLRGTCYRPLLKESCREYFQIQGDASAIQTQVKKGYLDRLTENTSESKKTGCAYLNEIFVRRHKKMLSKTANRIALAAAVLTVLLCAACLFVPAISQTIHGKIAQTIPPMLFLMYMINRGETITQLLFYNCDQSMLAFNIYKRRDVILKLFWERLITITRINLVPAAVIAAAYPTLILASGGTDRPWEYVLAPLTVLFMSVFFSVHYLTMYYLLQPFTVGLTQKGIAYRIVMTLTYVVCYFALRAEIDPRVFCFAVIGFSLLYIPSALLCTYLFAKKTFRIRS